MAAEWYIKVTADGIPLGHVAAASLPHDADGNPCFVTEARGKPYYLAAEMVQPSPREGERLTAPSYEVADGKATIRYAVEAIPPAPPAPLDAEEVWAVLEAKGLVDAGDRPRPKE
jgi:hypothetical protein